MDEFWVLVVDAGCLCFLMLAGGVVGSWLPVFPGFEVGLRVWFGGGLVFLGCFVICFGASGCVG